MKKVSSFKVNAPIITEKVFESTLQDGTMSKFTLLIDNGEWVLQGEDIQRVCESELIVILKEIQNLNKKLNPVVKTKCKNKK